MTKHVAYLAPEIPSPSATFVYREINALRRKGLTISSFTLHPVHEKTFSADGYPFLTETEVVYRNSLLADGLRILRQSLRRPLKTLKLLWTALRDSKRGQFAKPIQRGKLLGQAVVGLALASRLKSKGVAHLHVHFANSAANVGMYAAMAAGIPFSVTSHANDLWVEGSLLKEKIERAAFFRTISEANRVALIEKIGSVAKRVKVIHCGVEVPEALPTRDLEDEPKTRLLFIGRLISKKGCDVLLRAVHALKKAIPNIHVDVVGEGPHDERLRCVSQNLNIENRVSFHGFLGQEAIEGLMNKATAFVLPCREAQDGDRDGIPVVLMEAMAAGIPVISTDIPGIDELIEDEVSGRLVSTNNILELAAAIQEVVTNPLQTRRRAVAAHQKVAAEFSNDTNATLIADALNVDLEAAQNELANRPVDLGDGIVIVTPFRNEAKHLPRIIACMRGQTVHPTAWILVDDGSTDGGTILAENAAIENPWIKVVRRADRGKRVLGSGVVDAFNEGLASYEEPYSWVAKMDADMSFGPKYIESALQALCNNKDLACVSGKVYRPEEHGPVEEFMIDDMVAGQFKFYRAEAFHEIGGFVQGLLWDGIDYHRCRQSRWKTLSSTAPSLRLCHHRLMGSSDGNILRGRLRLGRGQWFMGTHPLYLLASATWRLLEKPYIIGGFLIVVGYIKSMLLRIPRYEDMTFRTELRNWQISRLSRLIKKGAVR